jgi:tetratricopeptide (TPR) repeat protein
MALVILPIGALTILGAPSMVGEYYFHRASLDRAAGNHEQAIANYRKAMKWDHFFLNGIEVYNLIGQLQIQSALGQDSAESAISRADALRAKGQYESAIQELQRAARKSPALAKSLRHEALRIQADWGLACYQVGAIEDAVTNLQEALDEDSKGRSIKSQPSMLYQPARVKRNSSRDLSKSSEPAAANSAARPALDRKVSHTRWPSLITGTDAFSS